MKPEQNPNRQSRLDSTDLVARLRDGCIWHQNANMDFPDINAGDTETLMIEAAGRIEALEKGIKEIGSIAYNGSGNDADDLDKIDTLADELLLSATAKSEPEGEQPRARK